MVTKKNISNKQKLDEMEQNWKRALADYQNLVKRTNEQQNIFRSFACLDLIERLIPVLDNLEMAAKHLNDAGLNMVVNQFWEALKADGLEKIESLNQEFDPEKMECVEMVEGKENLVTEVLVPGYSMGNRIIRVAKVKVGSILNKNKESK